MGNSNSDGDGNDSCQGHDGIDTVRWADLVARVLESTTRKFRSQLMEHEVVDIVQDAMGNVLTKMLSPKSDGSAQWWLDHDKTVNYSLTTAERLAWEAVRKKRRDGKRIRSFDESVDGGCASPRRADGDDLPVFGDYLPLVLQELNKLPVAYRRIIVVHYKLAEELPDAVVQVRGPELLKISPHAYRGQLAPAKEYLKELVLSSVVVE